MSDKTSEGIADSTTWNGSLATLIAQEDTFDPAYGFGFRQEWVGTQAQIDARMATAINAGWRATRSAEGDQHRLILTSPDPGMVAPDGEEPPPEVPVDVYDLATEYETSEIWTNPQIVAKTLTSNANTQALVLSAFRRFCTSRLRDLYLTNATGNSYLTHAQELEAVKNGTIDQQVARGMGPTPLDDLGILSSEAVAEFGFGDGNGTARVNHLYAIYSQMLMGLESWEVRRVVLSRRRTCSANYALRHVVDGVEKVYTTAALITTFDLPNTAGEIGTRLPANPTTTPPGTAWAWKIRRQDSQQLRGTGRIEEVIDWVFAAWSLSTHQLVS